MPEEVLRVSLGEQAAFQLANVTKPAPQFGAITPRWLVRFVVHKDQHLLWPRAETPASYISMSFTGCGKPPDSRPIVFGESEITVVQVVRTVFVFS